MIMIKQWFHWGWNGLETEIELDYKYFTMLLHYCCMNFTENLTFMGQDNEL